jgi:hypothetical protein
MAYSAENYSFLFDRQGGIEGSAREVLRHRDVLKYRAKTINSGKMLEIEIFPFWNTREQLREAKRRATREAQRCLNDKNARKKFVRKVNTNFGEDDIALTLTYAGDFLPDQKQARRDIQNYIRCVRRYRRKMGLPELKYIYVIEFAGDGGKPKRVHHHVIMSGMDRDEAERMWGKGWANARRLQPNENGFEAIARYITKERNGGSKRWCASKNLAEPKITSADRKISRRKAEKMAADFENAPAAIFAKLFPDYDFTGCEVCRSQFVAGVYIYARMIKKAQSPPKRDSAAERKGKLRNESRRSEKKGVHFGQDHG